MGSGDVCLTEKCCNVLRARPKVSFIVAFHVGTRYVSESKSGDLPPPPLGLSVILQKRPMSERSSTARSSDEASAACLSRLHNTLRPVVAVAIIVRSSSGF